MTKLIQQREFGHCGVAVLAMATGKPYEEILEHEIIAKKDLPKRGLSDGELIKVLRDSGIKNPRMVTDWNIEGISEKMIFTVPSLNHLGFLHYIFWDEDALDPSVGPKTYPTDGPVIDGQKMVFPATAIVWDQDDDV